MNENLNLVEILKDAPQGTKLWSPIIGECELVEVDENCMYPIKCKALDNNFWKFYSDGRYVNYEGAKCVLFPSEENKDWSTFKNLKTHKEFEFNQKVLVGLPFNNQYIWRRDLYLNYNKVKKMHCTSYEKFVPDSLIIPYDKDKDGKQVSTKYYISSLLDNDNFPKLQEDC